MEIEGIKPATGFLRRKKEDKSNHLELMKQAKIHFFSLQTAGTDLCVVDEKLENITNNIHLALVL